MTVSDDRGEFNEAQAIEQLPAWVPVYLAAWGSTGPDGARMMVKTAAELAGVSESCIRNWRSQSPQFKRLERMARYGSVESIASFVDAGLRGVAPIIFQSFMRLVNDGDGPTVREAMKWLRAQPEQLDIQGELQLNDSSPRAEIARRLSGIAARTEAVDDPGRSE